MLAAVFKAVRLPFKRPRTSPLPFKSLQPPAKMGHRKSKPLQTAIYCSVIAAAALSACAYGLARALDDGGAPPGELFLSLSPLVIASLCFAFMRLQSKRLGHVRRAFEGELKREREVSGLRLKTVESLAIAI